jgi:hypothetical protein
MGSDFGNIRTDSISFGGAKREGPCWCAMEERFTVNIQAGSVPEGIVWSFSYISIAVCEQNDSESWNENPPTIEITEDDIYIGWFRRKLCGSCTQEQCGESKIICRDKISGSGAIDNRNFQNMSEAILRLQFYAKNNPSRVFVALLDFVKDFMTCDPGPGCKRVSKLCSTVVPPPPPN